MGSSIFKATFLRLQAISNFDFPLCDFILCGKSALVDKSPKV